MQITEIIVHHLSYPVSRPYRNSISDWIIERPATLFEVITDNGLIGWGEGTAAPYPNELQQVIGRNPLEPESIYEDLCRGRNGIPAACGIEIALWDIAGKTQGVPVHHLLGGAKRDRVPAYASGFFQFKDGDHLDGVLAEVYRCLDDRFRTLKLRLGFGPDQDEQICAAVRKTAGTEIGLAVDINLGYDVETAIEGALRLTPHNVLWYEEPTNGDDEEGYAAIREAITIPIAGAEGLNGVASFARFMSSGAIDIAQPDISRAGGFSEGRRILEAGTANRVTVMPHMFGTAVRLAATLQWLATLPDQTDVSHLLPCYLEHDVTENALRTELSEVPFTLETDGTMAIPDRPGIGIEINRDILDRYAIKA